MHTLVRRAAALSALALAMSINVSAASADTPSWTDPRLGDPGTTLVSVPGFLADSLVYRSGSASAPSGPSRLTVPL